REGWRLDAVVAQAGRPEPVLPVEPPQRVHPVELAQSGVCPARQAGGRHVERTLESRVAGLRGAVYGNIRPRPDRRQLLARRTVCRNLRILGDTLLLVPCQNFALPSVDTLLLVDQRD